MDYDVLEWLKRATWRETNKERRRLFERQRSAV
jgi:hypothetical protein